MLNQSFGTGLFGIVPKIKIDKRYYPKSFETSLFNMIQKVENQKIYMFK